MDNLPEKKKPGLPARLTPMQRQFAELLVFQEGHKFAYECAKEAGYEGDNATLRKKASELQNPKYYPLVFKHIGELREEVAHKYQITVGRHLSELAKIRDEAIKHRSFSAATNAEVARGKAAGLYVDQKLILSGNLDQLSEKELESRMKQILDDHKVLIDGVAIEATNEKNNLNKLPPT